MYSFMKVKPNAIILYAQDVTGYKSGQFFFQILISVKSRGLRLIITDKPQGEKKKSTQVMRHDIMAQSYCIHSIAAQVKCVNCTVDK